MIDNPKKFVILVTAAPYSQQSADSALEFARAVVALGHTVTQVFFYADGAYLASSLASPPQSERKIAESWAQFASEHDINLVVCSNSALQRGIMDAQYAATVQQSVDNLLPAFSIAGLGQLVESVTQADRVICFKAPA